MNSFGNLFRVHIFGESHGACVGVIIDGVPAGLMISEDNFLSDLKRRKGGQQKGTTPREEADLPIFKSGIFKGKTTGAPLTILFENNNVKSEDYEKQRAIPRPGHADWVAHQKYGGHEDYRGSGHFSARLTTGIVAAGVIAKMLMPTISISANVISIGGNTNVEEAIQNAIERNDSVGGIIECRVNGLPAGLGEPYFNSLESMLSNIMFSIPAVRGIEFGTGFSAAGMYGSEHNDAIISEDGKTKSNHAGGIVGGITNGNELVFRLAIKPASSTPQKQQSINWETGQMVDFNIEGRHDLCVALRAPVIVEAATAIVLADCMMYEQLIPRVIK